jgi:hypothetical protein
MKLCFKSWKQSQVHKYNSSKGATYMNILVTTNVLKKIIFLGFETFNVNLKVVDAIELI